LLERRRTERREGERVGGREGGRAGRLEGGRDFFPLALRVAQLIFALLVEKKIQLPDSDGQR